MPGALKVWPDWPEFTEKTAELKPEYTGFKRDIVNEYGEETIKEAYVKVCGELERLTDEIAEKGTSMIPVVEFSEVENGLTKERKKELGDIGCFVVRGVVPEQEVNGLFKDLKTYVGDNKAHIGGWPKETPFVLRLFWSKTQVSLRTHPNHLLLQRALNSFWHDDCPSSEIPDFTEPLAYADAVRIRPPKIPFFGLGPHIDAGSLCRWADPTYRSAYGKIFSGKPEEHDCYDLGARKTVNQVLFDGGAHSSVLRAFQGWTALTGAGPREGSLLLYPNVKTVVAYLLLRPFFKEPGDEVQGEEERLKPENWTFDTESQWFPGTWQADSQLLSPGSHPHLRLRECMVNIPRMRPGDSIWWHCDMCHAVEVEHNGDNDASVAYIAATPSTIENIRYMKGQLQDFIKGVAPGDYDAETPEKQFKGFKGEEAILSGEVGRRAMGFGL